MNFDMLEKSIGTMVKLKPVPVTRTYVDAGQEYDAAWRIQAVLKKPFKAVDLYCPDSMHTVRIGFDNMQDYRTSGHLMLKCQVVIKGNEARCEPLSDARSTIR